MDNNVIYTGNTRYSIYDNDKRRKIGDKYVPYDAEIEYIENAGNNYISSTYVPKGTDIRIEGKFLPKGVSSNYAYWFGAYTGETYRAYRIISGTGDPRNTSILALSGRKASGGCVSVNITNITTPAGQVPYEFILDYDSISISKDGGPFVLYLNSGTTVTTENTEVMRLFRGATSSAYAYGRFYYFKLFKSNSLILDLIPVRVGTTGYMYDKVSKLLFSNAGTGNFTLGPDVYLTKPYDAEIEYLYSKGNAYINTGLLMYDHTLIGDFKLEAYVNDNALFGSWDNNSKVFHVTFYNLKYYFGVCSSEQNVAIPNGFNNNWHTYEINARGTFKLDNQVLYNILNTPLQSTTAKLLVFGRSTSTYPNGLLTTLSKNTKCRRFIVIDNTTNNIVLYLIPVRIGTVGYMYDKISGQLFANSGTGSFTLGPDIYLTAYDTEINIYLTKPYDAEIEYLRGTGGYINLGIYLNSDAYVELKFSPNTYTFRPYGIINSNNTDFSMRCVDSNLRFYYGTSSSSAYKIPTPNITLIYTTILDGNNYALYNASGTVLLRGNFTSTKFDSEYLCYLFAYNNKGSINGQLILIRSCKIINKDKILDLIPVRIGLVGYMYDKISGQLFEGIGSFTLGSDIN